MHAFNSGTITTTAMYARQQKGEEADLVASYVYAT